MSFLAAAFLTGLATLAVPWWLHWRDAQSDRQQTVSSLLLMRPGDVPEQTRRVLRHRWLLALRLLLVAVLALAFAQPVLERALAPAPGAVPALPRLIVLDASASMDADFAAARRVAHRLVDDLTTGERAAVVAAADGVSVIAGFTSDRAVLHGAVDAVRPGSGRLLFDGLVGRLTTLARGVVETPMETHLISDFQRSAMPDQFNGLVAGVAGPLVLHPLTANPSNWQIESIVVDGEVAVSVRGIHTPRRSLEVVLGDESGEIGSQTLAVPAAGRGMARFALPEPLAGAGWLRAVIDPQDALAVDDVRFRVLRSDEPIALPVFAPGGTGTQADYLRAAVTAAAPRFRPAPPEWQGPVAVALDAGGLSEERQQLLERHVHQGGSVLMTVGPASERAGHLPLVGDAALAGLGQQPRSVVTVDRTHPVLLHAVGWRAVNVTRVLTGNRQAGGRVLLTLDDGTPLLVERRLAAGRVLVLMTALDPAWSDLVARPVFVALVADALGYLAEDSLPVSAVAGRPLAIAAANVQLFDATGRRMLSLGDTVANPSVTLETPGIYTLRTPNRTRLLAVNPDPRESDLTPAPPALLTRWQASAPTVRPRPAPAEGHAGRTVPLAPWLLGLLAVLAVLEPVAANNASGRRWKGAAT